MQFSQYKKWSLFGLLLGALGFNLSMNPDHLQIARIEKHPLASLDLAQKAPEEKDSKAVKSEKITNREVLVGGKRGNFKAKVYQLDDSAVVRFEDIDKVEGKTCDLCGKAFVLSSEFKNIEDVNKELIAMVNDKSTSSEDRADEVPVKVAQKKGEATDVDLEEWAAKCDKVSDSGKLNCHKNRLIELSKYLKNSQEEAHFVTEYFNQYLKADIMTGFTSPTVKSNIFSNSFGMMQPTLESDTSLLEQSNEFSESIISGLRGKNGRPVAELLIKMRASSFTAQMRNSQRLLTEGINEGNSIKFQIGLQGMQPDFQKSILQQSTQSMIGAVDSMSASTTEKTYFQNFVGANLYTPVDSILTQLRSFITGQDAASANTKRNFADFQIPSLGESMIFMPNSTSIVNTSLESMIRAGSQSRGSDIRTQWGTGDGAITERNTGVPGSPNTAQQQYPNSPFNSTGSQQGVPAGRTARGLPF